jgi:hypothetical protein
MNLHTFKDAIKSKRSSLANEIIDDDDDDAPIVLLKREVEGEEDEGNEQVLYVVMCWTITSHLHFTTYND